MDPVNHPNADVPEIPFSTRRYWCKDPAIQFLMQQGAENPAVLSLAAGFVDQESLPYALVDQAHTQLFQDPRAARHSLQYSTTAGSRTLREQLVTHLRGLEQDSAVSETIGPDDIVVTTGSQQALSLIAQALLNPGDICLVSGPTYFVFLGVLQGLGIRAVPVTADQFGMQPEILERRLAKLREAGLLDRVKLIYAVSYYENPSGANLTRERREQLLDIARRWSKTQRLMILEDAAYRELDYGSGREPSIWGLDQSREHVILTQTFSKSFSPGIRVGYAVMPDDMRTAVLDLKSNEDFGSANYNQQLLATVLREGWYADHVHNLREVYRKKRDAMETALERDFQQLPDVHWWRPEGGLYFWLTLPASVATGFQSQLFRQATQIEKVMYVPGSLFFPHDCDPADNHLRLSFGVLDETGIQEGIRRLARAIQHVATG